MLTLEKISFAGWTNCLRLTNDTVELVITTDVGPRIVHFGWTGSDPSLFHLDPQTAGKTGGDQWHGYGGHRFWHSPEIKPRTYVPDNNPVDYHWDGTILRLVPGVEHLTGLQKIIEIRLHPSEPRVTLNHILVNHGPWEITAAPWALTVLAAGGTALIPQEPFIPFPDALLPARPLVLWQYTDMADARFGWQSRYISLRQDSGCTAPQKFGVRNSTGWGCYRLGDMVFVKFATVRPSASYPDFGCNFEVYTDAEFLELETLGPLQPIAAQGGTVEHTEQWMLAKVDPAASLDEVYQQVSEIATASA